MKYCSKCGSEVNSNQGFCMSCGSKIVNEQSSSYINKAKKDKMIIIGLISVMMIGTIFSFITGSKKSSEKPNADISNSSEGLKEDSNSLTGEDDYSNNDDKEDIDSDKLDEDKLDDINSPAGYYIDKYKNVDYIISESNTTKLKFGDLNKYTLEELLIARNEMLARLGYIFHDKPNLQAYFESKSWYKPSPNANVEFVGVASENYEMLKYGQFTRQAKMKSPGIHSDFVLNESNTKEIGSDIIAKLSDWELIVARNEIYARYGLDFSTKELDDYFKSKNWYQINSSVGNNVELSYVEHKNIATIIAEEKSRIERKINYDLDR